LTNSIESDRPPVLVGRHHCTHESALEDGASASAETNAREQ